MTMLCPPFFDLASKIADDFSSDSVAKTIQNIFNTFKPDVKPIKKQITTTHDLMIDVLPF